MLGEVKFTVKSRRVSYEITVDEKLSIIRGDSGTGKTSLSLLLDNKEASVSCKYKVVHYTPTMWSEDLAFKDNQIYLFDEDCGFITSKEFATSIFKVNSYFIFITRKNIYNMSISINSVYKLHHSGKYVLNKKLYNFDKYVKGTDCDCVLTEDSKSGYQFIKALSDKEVFSADGKDNLYKVCEQLVHLGHRPVLLVDSLALSHLIDDLLYLCDRQGVTLLVPRSIEFLILECPSVLGKVLSKDNLSNLKFKIVNLLKNDKTFIFSDISYEDLGVKLLSLYMSEKFQTYYSKNSDNLLVFNNSRVKYEIEQRYPELFNCNKDCADYLEETNLF